MQNTPIFPQKYINACFVFGLVTKHDLNLAEILNIHYSIKGSERKPIYHFI